MNTQVSENTFSYLVTLNEIKDNAPPGDVTSFPKLITITMVANTGREMDLPRVRESFPPDGLRIRFAKSPDANVWHLKQTQFYNQVTLFYTDKSSTKSIKIFSNGSIQVAGCTDLFDCHRVIRQVGVVINHVLGIVVNIQEFRICMINANFQFNKDVNLRNCARHLSEQPGMSVNLSRDRYAAVKVKFKPADDMKQMTASIFSTGKAILSGAETLKEIALGYNRLVHLMNHPGILEDAKPVEMLNSFQGFPITEWARVLKDRGTLSWQHTQENRRIIFSQ
tara:strand:+ start:1545 stop:2384 length:840 start_codon:yes stop_codon:yes gene_type:complete